jgi:hypothetical protein
MTLQMGPRELNNETFAIHTQHLTHGDTILAQYSSRMNTLHSSLNMLVLNGLIQDAALKTK